MVEPRAAARDGVSLGGDVSGNPSDSTHRWARIPRRSWFLACLPAAVLAALALWVAATLPQAQLLIGVALLPGLLVLMLVALAVGIALLMNAHRLRAKRNQQLEAAREQERDHAAGARRRFLRRLDHELKNPVTALRALAAEGAAGAALGMDTRNEWASASTQALRMSRLVGELRGLAELEVSELDVERVRVDELIREALADLAEGESAGDLARRQVRVHLPEAPWPLPEVTGDPDLLRVVFHNVIGNAVKYSAAQDRIEITGREGEGTVLLEVADTGRGIPESELDLVFEELARGSNAADRHGSGVGLSLVRIIVERHGGSVTLLSREGEGSSVRIQLPLPPAPPTV